MSKILFKDGSEKLVDAQGLQFILDIKNAKRDQIFTFIPANAVNQIKYVWSGLLNKWILCD